ncbi:MAG: LysM peptidoglycan-binding domain-containing protein [Actinomycetota bacterium]|nr:LysM peptidoglycan-binding domain-containing protein [Actinomycetota bacterium]
MATVLVSTSTEREAIRSSQVAAPVKPVYRPVRRPEPRPCPPGRWRVVTVARAAAPPECEPRRSPIPVAVLLGVAVIVALVVYGLGAFAGSMVARPDVPETTTVVRVAQGETLSELATRMAPDSDVSAVVAKIRELNGLSNATVRVGQALTVPVAAQAG